MLVSSTRNSIRDELIGPMTLIIPIALPQIINRRVIAHHVSRLLERPEAGLDFKSSFVGLGGQSMLAVKLASACKRSGVKISVASILLSESIDEIIASATSLEYVSMTKQLDNSKTLIPDSCRSTLDSIDSQKSHVIEKQSSKSHLTEMQMSFIHSYKSRPGTNIINFYETYKTADIPAMKAAWKRVIETEPIFRYSFASIDTIQINNDPFHWTETIVDTVEALNSELARDVVTQDPECSFDVLTFPLLETSTVIWRVHHAFVDGISSQMLYAKVRRVLNGLSISAGTPFINVARELQDYQSASHEANRRFWNGQREKHPQPATEINLPSPDSTGLSGVGNVSLTIPFNEVAIRAQETGVSLATWYEAAWALVLSIYSDSDSVVFGSVRAGRDLSIAGVEDTVGPLINTLPFNVSIDPKTTTTHFLRSMFNDSVELGSFQSSVPDDGFSRNFTTALSMEFEMQPSDDYSVRPIGQSWFRVTPDIPLSVYMNFHGTLRACFHLQKYKKADIELLAETYRQAILVLLSPTKTIKQCLSSLITDDSRSSLMRFGNCLNNNTSLSSINEDLITLYERAARENPNAIALQKGEKRLSYASFDKLASRLAWQLKDLVQPGDVICVHADRSINWIIAIYGILKARAVYSAQDAALPSHIRNTNFETAGATIFLTPSITQKELKPESCSLCLSVEELISDPSTEAMPHRRSPKLEDNAYLCFTSGSTGKPKGVICHHAGLVAFQKNPEVRFFAAPGQRISQLMSPAFDGSIHEIFSTLSYGATLVLSSSADPFAQLQESTAAIFTPSIAKILDPDDFPNLKAVYLVGEPVPQHVCDTWASKKALYNMYGPTEATCGATLQRLRPNVRVNIGPPNQTTRVYVLDRNQQLLPPGVVGEIYLAGIQVARGYIGRPELTAERFLPDGICSRPGEMMYRTGDRGFFNSLGEVECLGRNDRQIKLRGFRLDMNDLEIRIAQAIPEATAVAICPKDDYLVTMVQPETLTAANIRSRIINVLPVHAIPRHILPVNKFPMTPAGKLDYNEIAKQCVPTIQAAKAPANTSELVLAQIWREVLGLPADVAIHRDSNFMALGGHSIMQLRLAGKLSAQFGAKIPLSSIVCATNLAELAQSLEAVPKQSSPLSIQCEPLGRSGVSPIEHEWFKKYSVNAGSSAFNVTYACSIDLAELNLDHLIASWNAVLARHAIFRSRYLPAKKGEGARRAYARFPPQVIQVRSLDLWREVNRPFQLDKQPPIRITVSKGLILASMSHIIADLTTLQALLKEVTHMYHGQGLPPVIHSYADTTQWSSSATSAQRSWWSDYLMGTEERKYSMPNVNLTSRSTYGGRSHLLKLDRLFSSKLISFSEARKITLHQLGLGAVALALQPEASETDIVLGGPYLNRQQEDLETVGLFLEPIPIRIRSPPSLAIPSSPENSFIQHVQSCSQQAIGHAMPWNQILSAVHGDAPSSSFPNHPLLDVMVTFHDQRSSDSGITGKQEMNIPGLSPLITYTKGSKFALLVEFCALASGDVMLRLEYDTQCISKEHISGVANTIVKALEGIIAGKEEAEIKDTLRKHAGSESRSATEEEDGWTVVKEKKRWFGRKVAEI